jgi:hypothetical protein
MFGPSVSKGKQLLITKKRMKDFLWALYLTGAVDDPEYSSQILRCRTFRIYEASLNIFLIKMYESVPCTIHNDSRRTMYQMFINSSGISKGRLE